MIEKNYIGSKLEIFAKAEKWKNYFSRFVSLHLGADVLEVGAGIGATTEILCQDHHTSWLCLKPDGELLAEVDEKIDAGKLPAFCKTQQGLIVDLGENTR